MTEKDFEPFLCPVHQIMVETADGCTECMDEWNNRPNADLMTPMERKLEFGKCMGIMTIPFRHIHQRVEELVGRPVWTHELGLNVDGLESECLLEERHRQPDMEKVLGSWEKTGKPMIVVEYDADE